MDRKFILTCESTVDMPFEYINGRDIPVLFYKYIVNDTEYEDDMRRTPDGLDKFYGLIDAGNIPTTSQINQYGYKEFLEQYLKQGDLIHICMGTGMSGSYYNAAKAAEELKEEYPDRKIEVINSFCSSTGYGMLVDYAADMRDEGKSFEETVAWVNEYRTRIHHQFYAVDLKYYKRTGRMSGPTATLAAVLDICPIMRLNKAGEIIAYDKVRGKKKAIKVTIENMKQHAIGGLDYNGKLFICHSRRPEDAELTRQALVEAFPQYKPEDIRICDIGMIIGSHCGPGTLAIFFLGDERAEGKK